MNVKRFVALSILAATCAFTYSDVSAQSLARDAGPAETPPASFKGNQYVDSKGCVYIRAGVDGNTNWVPRVSRSRKVVCGLSPSIRSGGATAVAAAPKPAEPVQIGTNVTAPKSPAPAPSTRTAVRPARATVASVLAPKPVRTVASKPVVKRAAPKIKRVNIPQPSGVQAPPRMHTARIPVARPQAQPRVIRIAPQQPVVQTTRRVATSNVQRQVAGTQNCRGASAVSQRYIGGRGVAVRCGPQSGPIVTTRAGDARGGTFRSVTGQVLTNVNPNARIVPRHVYENQRAAAVVSPTPSGYRDAWTDDRLNPRRAHQTLAGKAKTEVIWTQTVPRRLIVRSTGRDVTRSFPGLRYPYTSLAQQAAALGQNVQTQTRVISSKGTAAKRVVRKTATVQRQQTRVSTRSTTPRKPSPAAGKRFVQVGTFSVASNAQSTASRIQRMGLPVRIGKFNRGGKQMRIVLAGPFASAAHTNGAVTAVRNAGFRDAFARN
ncbi:SPOR domain-containing protein [Planktotalea sp.]|uniref:SPOR domain-containing protein n=1 Tax=Planktotalea sp. TaxID=2029877 RepID=UPI003D6A1BF5